MRIDTFPEQTVEKILKLTISNSIFLNSLIAIYCDNNTTQKFLSW